MKLLLKIVILTVACVVIIKSCSPYLGGENQLIGQPAPDFTLATLSGSEVNMTQLRNGRPALIFFWATWCPHCRKQLKALTTHHGKIESDGIKIILINIGENAQNVRRYMNTNNILLDVFLDQNEELALAYHIVGVPTFFFLNNEGTIVAAENALPKNYKEILLSRVAL